MDPVRVAVVGVGEIGRHHARIYAGMPQAVLVGVADIRAERAAAIGGAHGVPATADYRTLLGQVDAVSVAVPTTAHGVVAAAFLETGADALVEKPLADSVEEAEALVAVAARRGRILQVGHVERYNGAVRALDGIVTEPGFIECHRLGPFVGRGTDVDVILDLMIHDIDIILSLVRSPVVAVHAVGVPVISPQADIANARLQFASGCVANVTASRVSPERMRKIRIFQRDTYISLDYAAQAITRYRRIPPPPGGAGGLLSQIMRDDVPIDKAEPLQRELEDFVSSVRTRRPPRVSGEEGLQALRIAAQILAKL